MMGCLVRVVPGKSMDPSRRDILKIGALAAAGSVAESLGEESNQSAAVSEVLPHLGAPRFFLEGQPCTTPVFETYVPDERYFRQFAEAGTSIFSFSVNLGHGFGPELWRGPDRFDFSRLDTLAERVLRANPDGWIMPRIYLSPPDWWIAENPEERQLLGEGSYVYREGVGHRRDGRAFPSLASSKWRRDTAHALRRTVRHMLGSEYGSRVFGFMVTGLMSEEWYHWSIHTGQLSDYSGHAHRAFQRWLKDKYQTEAALREAWHDKTATFGHAKVPTQEERQRNRERTFRDPASEMPVIDWYLFYNELVPDTIDYFCKAAKEACHGRHVVGSFYAYMFEFGGDPEYGHNALGKLLRSDHLDFVMVTASYHDRGLGKGADYARSPITSVRLHEKLWYHDNDTVSFLYDRIHQTRGDRATIERYRRELGVTKNAEESIWQYRRSAGFALANGVFQSFFDLHGGYFDHPNLMGEVARLNTIFSESTDHDFSSTAEILVVSDEASCSYTTFESGFLQQTLRPAQLSFSKIGAPHDSILLEDLGRVDPDRYRLVIFLNCFHLGDAQRTFIRDRVLKKRRTVVWCYACGLFNGAKESLAAAQELTGFPLRWGESQQPSRARIVLQPGFPLLGDLEGTVGSSDVWARKLTVEADPSVTPLGRLESTDLTAFALRRGSDWTSVYTMNAVLPPGLWRSLARDAGVHIYNQHNDTLYANRSYVCLNADGEGERTIRFPRKVSVVNTSNGKLLLEGGKTLTRHLRHGETLLLRITS